MLIGVCLLGLFLFSLALKQLDIFPLEKESLYNSSRWISDMDHISGVSKINSLQNGGSSQVGDPPAV